VRPRRRGEIKIADFDVTPMVDVTMLLIIFFMLTMHFANAARVSPMNLPQEKGDIGASRDQDAFIIDVRPDGSYGLGAESYDVAGVVARAKIANDQANTSKIVVRADKDRPVSDVDRLARALAAAGIRNWKLATSGSNSAPPPGGTP
jgi:biopolymer transport protein ExbD